jgi:hypothetical protein
MDRWHKKQLVKHTFTVMPWGVTIYDWLTAAALNSQRAVPGKWCRWFREHLVLIRRHAALDLEQTPFWCIDVGATMTPGLLARAVTNCSVLLTDTRARLRERYCTPAVTAVCADLENIKKWAHTTLCNRDLFTEHNGLYRIADLTRRFGLDYIAPAGEGDIETGGFGLCMSMGALEHRAPQDLAGLIHTMARALRKGGVASHIVDHRDHLWHFDATKDCFHHLRFSDEEWLKLAMGPLLYVNRLLRSDYIRLFETAGFAVRYAGYGLHEGDTAGVVRERLWGRFASASAEDLHAAVSHFVAVKR